MLPVLNAGSAVPIQTYAAMLALAVVLSLWVARRTFGRSAGLDASRAWRALLVLGLVTFAGGRLHLVVNYWSWFAERPLAIPRPWAGMHAGGAVIALALAAPFVTRRYGVPLGRFADAIVPACGVGIAVARLGCFLHGCCFGRVCDLPWCVTFPRTAESFAHHAQLGIVAADAARSASVHPLQLYFAAAGVAVALLGVVLQRQKAYDGQVALLALVVFAATSAALEPVRADLPTRVYWGSLPQLQVVANLMTLAGVAALFGVGRVERRARQRSSA